MKLSYFEADAFSFFEMAAQVALLLQFFEMPRHEAVKALDIYRRACQQVKIYVYDI